MTFADLYRRLLNMPVDNFSEFVLVQSDGWILVGPSEQECLDAWDAKQLHNTPLPDNIIAVTT